MALSEIQEQLLAQGKKLQDFDLPIPPANIARSPISYFDILAECQMGEDMRASLNPEQTLALDTITAAMMDQRPVSKCFFLDGPGGSGKTYLYKALLSTVRGNGEIALPVASTGIAANLLKGGRTYHSQYKLPVPLLENSTSSMRMTSPDANVIRQAKILIWDESTMAPSVALDAVDRLLKDIMKNDVPFGGKVLLLGGDFRQTLPVIPNASRAAIVEASLKFNRHWHEFKPLTLKNNVRSVDLEYSDFLIKVGNGELLNSDGLPEDIIEIPQDLLCSDDLVKQIFGDKLTVADVALFAQKAILSPKNDSVDEINERILDILEGVAQVYISSDSIVDETEQERQNCPVEFLNSLNPSGMSPHKLRLKIGSIIMLLRNLNSKRGLCNGTRMIIKDLKPNLIIAEVLTGSVVGQIVFVPRIDLDSNGSETPFVLRRRQFPIKLAFAMTINKSQGQTLDKLGIYLPEPVFGHGQLYTAMSRVKRRCDVQFKIFPGPEQGNLIQNSAKVFTKNIVYKEIFQI